MTQHASENRFSFGQNWAEFLKLLSDERIATAEDSLRSMLRMKDLRGQRFVDVGCGSGIFSLAARRLGASVFSFDFDTQSVACAKELRRRYFPDDDKWEIVEGSVLDLDFLHYLGKFDVVYSWGVLHHTGAMWSAMENVCPLVADDGHLFVSIYNDQGKYSKRWLWIKKTYNSMPPALRFLVLWPCAAQLVWRSVLKDFLLLRPFHHWREYRKRRGMSQWHDIVDWVGGLPFEVATVEQVFGFYHDRGFSLENLLTSGGTLGCNQFVFRRRGGPEERGASARQAATRIGDAINLSPAAG
jgi:2-polyprenyl-6-hydroxyphenyl methylase/3-demethylubiquinone-9 3-methyltransferase